MKSFGLKKLLAATFLFLLPFAAFSQEQLKEKLSITFKSNMDCSDCVKTLTDALAFEKGVTDLKFDLEKNLITIEYKNWKTDPTKLRERIVKTGYLAEEVKEKMPEEGKKQ